ncbi:MAG: flagellar hook-length control protein FliK [Bacterioplanes sp.]|nr:flagellar hook-length control protein FliK [Bacterioplanes sp.]
MNKDAETLADIKNMSTDFIPLLSSNTLQRAGFNTVQAESRGSSTQQVFQASVQLSEKTDSGYRLTLTQDNQTLVVESPRHHAKGDVLTLQLDTDSDGKFRVTVLSSSSAIASNEIHPPLTQAIHSGLTRLIQLAGESTNPSKSLPFAQAPLAQAMQEWLISRHILNPQRSEQDLVIRHTYQDALTTSASLRARPDVAPHTHKLSEALLTLSHSKAVPLDVRTIIQNYLQQRPSALTADSVRAMLQQSGLFYEQQLLQRVQQSLPATASALASTLPNAIQTTFQKTFQALWQRPNTPSTSTSAPSTTRPAEATTLQQTDVLPILQRVKQQLNATAMQLTAKANPAAPEAHRSDASLNASPPTAPTAVVEEGVATLLRDTKAMLAHAIHRWQQSLTPHSQPPSPSPILLQQLQTHMGSRPEGLLQLQTLLATIELEQHQALQRDVDQTQWQTTLLWRDGEQWRETRIQRQADEDTSTTPSSSKQVRWRLNLHFDLQRLGPLDVELDLRLPTLAATFWSKNASSLAALNAALQPLKSRLQAMGVDVQQLQVRHGQLPIQQQNRIEHHLVDVHT